MKRRALTALVGLAALVTTGLSALSPTAAGAANGDLDPTFSGDGVQQLNGTGDQPTLQDAALAPDGGIIVVGSNQSGASDGHAIIGRLLGDGSFDTAFGGGDGLVELQHAQMYHAESAVVGPDGRIYVAGSVGTPSNIAVARLNADGSLDTTFDGDGVRAIDLFFDDELGHGIALDSTGRILVAADGTENNDRDFLTVRLLTNGATDTDFGTNGLIIESDDISDGARAIAADSSDRVVVAGFLGAPGFSSGAVFRYTVDGDRDPTFNGGNGVSVLVEDSTTLQGLVLDGDSPIVGGTGGPGGVGSQEFSSFVVRRFSSAGVQEGSATIKGADGGWNLSDLDRRPDGFLVAVGTEFGPNLPTGREIRGAVAQLTPALALDTSFSGDGMATLNLGETDEGVGVAYDLDGRPVVAGRTTGAGSSSGTLARFQNHTRMATVAAGGSLSTGAEASPLNPVTTSVTTPVAGTISITERRVDPSTSGGYSFLGVAVDITAPQATAADPLHLVFRLDASLVDRATSAPLAEDVQGLTVFRNGAPLPRCDAGTAAAPDPCLEGRGMTGDDVVLQVRTSTASTWTFGVALPGSSGRYWMAASDGGVFTFGTAAFFGSTGDIKLNSPMVGMAVAPDGNGYWMVAADGGVFAFGSSEFYGSMGGTKLNSPVVAMAAAPDGKGYWLVAADGGVFSFGSASFFGSMGGTKLNQPIVGMDAAPDGQGYWMVASDGGIFSFGTSTFFGSMGGTRLNQPIVGMTSAPDGQGYWMVASDGGIFTFGTAAFLGSTGDIKLNKPIVSMSATPDGAGYWMFASDGGVFTFGTAPFLGSLGDIRLNQPVVAGAN
jgi:uncharacterized delta-60 repeat protein